MAARIEPAVRSPVPELLDLRQISSGELTSLLNEEIRTWEETLEWDFRKSADLVSRFVDMRVLNGYALVKHGSIIGYSYYVLEEHKGLVGDLFVRRADRTVENENRLLTAVLSCLIGAPHVRRIESQLMMTVGYGERPLPHSAFLHKFEREFMILDMEHAPPLPAARVRRGIRFERWAEQYQESAACLIASAYLGHIDSRINDQYRSAGGARRFLFNIVQYPGCGTFFNPASFVAVDTGTGELCGLCLTSLVGPEVGHLTQICVSPRIRRTGVGHELLRQSLLGLRSFGCRKASLTVTSANREAIAVYDRAGFVTARKFSAYVWEGF